MQETSCIHNQHIQMINVSLLCPTMINTVLQHTKTIKCALGVAMAIFFEASRGSQLAVFLGKKIEQT